MIRTIIHIDEEKCNGCGACAAACHEGAISMVNGKAKLMRDDYCDGLGDCLPGCPTGAITFVQREAAAYDEKAVLAAKAAKAHACPGSAILSVAPHISTGVNTSVPSRLTQWPIQLKLVPDNAAFFSDCSLLIAADCCAYAYGAFHNEFIAGHTTVIGCPKLDGVNYAEKFARGVFGNTIRSITLTRMEVPCCGGLVTAVKNGMAMAGKQIPLEIVTISSSGKILKREKL